MWKQTRKYFDSFNTPGSKPEEKKPYAERDAEFPE
jgi:hypothetical protein